MMFRNTPSPVNFGIDNSSSSSRSDDAVRRTGCRGFEQMTPLAPGFIPGNDDVLVGRGKKCLIHIGNLNFKKIVATKLSSYLAAESRVDKTAILVEVIAQVRTNSLNGGFVKQNPKTGQWFEVGDFLAKEKTAQAFRDALHEYYSSSNPSKKKRRIQSTVSSDSSKRGDDGKQSLGGENNSTVYVTCQQTLSSAMHSRYPRRLSKSAPNSPTRDSFPTEVHSATPPPSFGRLVTVCETHHIQPPFSIDETSFIPSRRKSSGILSGDALATLSSVLTDTHFSDYESANEDPFEPIPLFFYDGRGHQRS